MGPIAQSVEQRTFNPWVDGSSPSGPTCIDIDEFDRNIGQNMAILESLESYLIFCSPKD